MNQSQVSDLQVKLSLDYNNNTVIKRIPNVQTYNDLLKQAQAVCSKAGVDPSVKIHLKYFDADNERVGVEDDSDLQLAYASALSSDKRVKFQIELNGAKQASPDSVNEAKPVQQPIIEVAQPVQQPIIEVVQPIQQRIIDFLYHDQKPIIEEVKPAEPLIEEVVHIKEQVPEMPLAEEIQINTTAQP